METGQHPQLVSISVVTETDLTPVNQSAERSQRRWRQAVTSCCGSDQLLDSLSVSSAGAALEGLHGKSLDLTLTQLFGLDGTLTLLKLQQSLKDECCSQHAGCRYLLCVWMLLKEHQLRFCQKRTNVSSPRSRLPEGSLISLAEHSSSCPAYGVCVVWLDLSKRQFRFDLHHEEKGFFLQPYVKLSVL